MYIGEIAFPRCVLSGSSSRATHQLLDANILLYAYDSDSAHHAVCRSWLEAALNSEETVALPWPREVSYERPQSGALAKSLHIRND
jgi:hypothetical protein